MLKKGSLLYTYNIGSGSNKRTVESLGYLDDILNDKKIVKVMTDLTITDDYLSVNRFSTYLDNPYPLKAEYADNRVLVDLDNNGIKDEVTLLSSNADSTDVMKLKKDVGVALNGGSKKVFTSDSSKFIFLDAIDIDSDGYVEILAFEVSAQSGGSASLIMLKVVNEEVVKITILQI